MKQTDARLLAKIKLVKCGYAECRNSEYHGETNWPPKESVICTKIHHIMRKKNLKTFSGRGIAPFPHLFFVGRGNPSQTQPLSSTPALRSSRLRRSILCPPTGVTYKHYPEVEVHAFARSLILSRSDQSWIQLYTRLM